MTKILLTGDLCLAGRPYEALQKSSGKSLLSLLEKEIGTFDFMISNLEAPFLKEVPGSHEPPIWALSHGAAILKELKVKAVSLANNHTLDYGERGLSETCEVLKNEEIGHSGIGWSREEAFRPAVLSLPDLKLGLLSFSFKVTRKLPWGRAVMAEDGQVDMERTVSALKKQTDRVVVAWHSGIEYASAPLLPNVERCRRLIEAGADVVCCHHPHVAQGFEAYQNGIIFYSLGNFIFDRKFLQDIHSDGLAVLLEMDRHKLSATPRLVRQDPDNGLPLIQSEEETEARIQILNSRLHSRKEWIKNCRIFVHDQLIVNLPKLFTRPFYFLRLLWILGRAPHHWRILAGTVGF